MAKDEHLEVIKKCLGQDHKNIQEIIKALEIETGAHKHWAGCRLWCPTKGSEAKLAELRPLVTEYAAAIDGINAENYDPAIALLEREIRDLEKETGTELTERIVKTSGLQDFVAKGAQPLILARKHLIELRAQKMSHPPQ